MGKTMILMINGVGVPESQSLYLTDEVSRLYSTNSNECIRVSCGNKRVQGKPYYGYYIRRFKELKVR